MFRPSKQGERVVWVRKGVAEVQPFEPPPLKPGEVLVRSHVTLISPGTERAFFLSLPNAAFALDDQLPDAIRKTCAPAGPAAVIEATGYPQPILLAFQLAKRFGRVVLLGSTRGETEKVNFYRDVHQKGLTIIGAHNSSRPRLDSAPGWWSMADDWRLSLKLLEAKRLIIEPLITHRFPAKDASKAYALLASGDLNLQAMLLDWERSQPAAPMLDSFHSRRWSESTPSSFDAAIFACSSSFSSQRSMVGFLCQVLD